MERCDPGCPRELDPLEKVVLDVVLGLLEHVEEADLADPGVVLLKGEKPVGGSGLSGRPI